MMLQSINIIFENDDFLVINKPSLIHSTGEGSIQEELTKEFPSSAALPEAGMLQRLDHETSGALAVAKTFNGLNNWKAAYQNGQITKKYLLLVEGSFPKPQEINGYFGSRHRGSKKVSFSETKKKRFLFASTKFETFKTAKDLSLLLATTTHGRRHQVRASAAELGFPLIGDDLYGGNKADHPFFLHAYEIEFLGNVVKAEIFEEQRKLLEKLAI